MKTYKAEISRTVENLWLNPKTGDYEGTDPDTFQDLGHYGTITASTKAELKKKIETQFGPVEHDQENIYLYSCDLEYHYNVPVDERVPALEEYTFHITEVDETNCTLD